MNREDKIAKKIVALNSGEVQGLFNKYEEPELLYDAVKEFSDLGKIIQRDTTYQNDKDWWKIFKLDFDADTFQDELIDYIAHKYFLRILKQVSNINKLKEGVDKFNSENQNTDPKDLTRKQIAERVEQARQFQNILSKCEKQSRKIGGYIQKMIESCSNLIGGDIAKFGRDKSQKKMYQGLIKNKAILKALDELKTSLAEVKTKLEDPNGDYQFSDLLSVTPAATSPRVVKKASQSGDTFNAILQKYNDALKNKTYKKEEAAPAGGNAGGKPAAGGGKDVADKIEDGKDYSSGISFDKITNDIETLKVNIKGAKPEYLDEFRNSGGAAFATLEEVSNAINVETFKNYLGITNLSNLLTQKENKKFYEQLKESMGDKCNVKYGNYFKSIYQKYPVDDKTKKALKSIKSKLEQIKAKFESNVEKGGDSDSFRITRIARRIADSYLE